MQPDPDLRDASFGELFKRLSSDMTLLLRQELDLFRTEMTEKMRSLGPRVAGGAGLLSGAAVCGLFALAAFTTTIILALALVMPAWGAALIVAFVYSIAAAVFALSGKRTLDEVELPVPKETIATVKEDVEWAKTRASSAKR